MIALLITAALAGRVCAPPPELDTGPTITGRTAVRVERHVWAASARCLAGGAVNAPGDGRRRFVTTACYLPETDEVVISRDGPSKAYDDVTERHEMGHARGGVHPGTLDGCGPWIISQPLIDAIKAADAQRGRVAAPPMEQSQ